MYEWNRDDWRRWEAAVAKRDFRDLDKESIVMASLQNASDVSEENDPVGAAISTMDMYLDDSEMYRDMMGDYVNWPHPRNESVTGIGGRGVRSDDPSLGGEYQGHPGLDEEEGEGFAQQVRDRLKNLEDMYGPERAKGMLNKKERAAIGEMVEFVSDHGIRYSGRVVTMNSRHVIVEMHDKRRVSTRTGNPSLKKL